MFKVLILLAGGIALGYGLRHASLVKKTEKSVSATVLLMLFVFGITIGSNSSLVNNLGKYGAHAAILAVAGVTGSIVTSYIAYRMVSKKRKGGGE